MEEDKFRVPAKCWSSERNLTWLLVVLILDTFTLGPLVSVLNRRVALALMLLVLLFSPFVSISRGEEEKASYGVSVSGGFSNESNGHRFTRWAFLPRVDLPLHRYWDLEFEGNFSYYGNSEVKDLYVLGLNVNILFKPIRWDKNALFLLAGAGLGYNNSTERDHKEWDIGNTHVAGTLQGGLGIEYFIGKGCWLRGEYRFNHISDPFKSDPGINSHNFMLGISF